VPVQSLAEFILYIIPGFIAIQVYRRNYPAKERNSFIDIANSIVLGVLIISSLRWTDRTILNGLLYSGFAGIPGVRFSLAIIVAGLLVGVLGILQLELRSIICKKHRWLRWFSPGTNAIWQDINHRSVADWCVVFLCDGSIYMGWISKYCFDPNSPNQDFLLTHAKRVDERLSPVYEVDGQGVYLNTRDVKRIEFIKGKGK
jgi:hypothetical protein